MSAKGELKTYLESNPRMIGALFTVLLLLSQTGTASAALVSGNPGP